MKRTFEPACRSIRCAKLAGNGKSSPQRICSLSCFPPPLKQDRMLPRRRRPAGAFQSRAGADAGCRLSTVPRLDETTGIDQGKDVILLRTADARLGCSHA